MSLIPSVPLATLLGALLATTAPAAQQPLRRFRIEKDFIRHERGFCYTASMDFGEEGDKFTGNKSGLLLFEDGKPLGPPRSAHEDIRKKGHGRYSHWTREQLYFSTSDNSDPRTNGRTYAVASTNPRSSLGGLKRLPATHHQHVEDITANHAEYVITMGGTVDSDNTKTLATGNCYITFQNNVSLTIENVGDTAVVNPRLVLNDRGNWYTFDSLLAEFTRGAGTEQDKAYFIWEHMRQNLYHEWPLFGNAEPHDPVRLFNIFGFNLCDDAGNAGCSLFYHAGLTGSKKRALHGHVQCEASVDGKLEFLDVDMDCFYLDRENERPVSGNQCARDHDLVRRELNYGPVVARFTSSDGPAALFGPDDRLFDARLRGHEIAYTLRPREKVVFRWDNIGKYAAESQERCHRPKYYGNSKFSYRPRLTLAAVQAEAASAVDVKQVKQGLAGVSATAHVDYEIEVPYTICGGTVEASFLGGNRDRFRLGLSLDGKNWKTLWTAEGPGEKRATVSLDSALAVHRAPAKYRYLVRVGLSSAEPASGAVLRSLRIDTDVMAAPTSLPRLHVGRNEAVYWDATAAKHHVRITHEWKESSAVTPLPPPSAPTFPPPGAKVQSSIVTFRWPKVDGAERYHLRVSRRPDFAYPYRPCLDVIIPTTEWSVPYTGIYSPDTTYYWRLRSADQWGVWGPWSDTWTFTWHGPRVPVHVRLVREGTTFTLHWDPNPRGPRPVKYEVYGSDEKGFSIEKRPPESVGRGAATGNFVAATTGTSLVVIGPRTDGPNTNRVYYRVVAIDADGTASGCSDYAEAPHPFLYSAPVTTARVGRPYRYQARSLCSLNDVQHRSDPPGNKFWDKEKNTFTLAAGPEWLSIDRMTGLLTGTPTAPGRIPVKLVVTNQFHGRAEQGFDLHVSDEHARPGANR